MRLPSPIVCVTTQANINCSLMAENWAYSELSSTPLGPQITNHLMLKAAAPSAAGTKGQTHVRSELLLTQDTSLPTCLWSSGGPHQEREESSRGKEWNNFISCTVMLPLKSACEECAKAQGTGGRQAGKRDNGDIGPSFDERSQGVDTQKQICKQVDRSINREWEGGREGER